MEAAAKGAAIGGLIMWLFGWLAARIALVLGILIGLAIVGYLIAPMWNDDANKSEIQEMAQRRVSIESKMLNSDHVAIRIDNDSRFLLRNLIVTCGPGNSSWPQEVVPHHITQDLNAHFTNPIQPCTMTYEAVESGKKRSANILYSLPKPKDFW
jgi:hypothetical protein